MVWHAGGVHRIRGLTYHGIWEGHPQHSEVISEILLNVAFPTAAFEAIRQTMKQQSQSRTKAASKAKRTSKKTHTHTHKCEAFIDEQGKADRQEKRHRKDNTY